MALSVLFLLMNPTGWEIFVPAQTLIGVFLLVLVPPKDLNQSQEASPMVWV
jgi:hypothetical protein